MIGVELSSQLDVLEKHLYNLGYCGSDGAVVRSYEFAANEGQVGCADLLAFADARRWDISTACIAVQQWPNGHDKLTVLRQLSYIGAPIALFALPDFVEIWPVRADSEVVRSPQESLSYEKLLGYFNQRRKELSPRSLLNAKRGEWQLSFFDIDPALEAFARDATQEMLVRQFERALNLVPPKVRKSHPKALTRLAIWTLAARILQDKLTDYDDLRTKRVKPLLSAVQRHFPDYFKALENDLSVVGMQAVEALYSGLGGEFTLRSLTNDMLAYFYENTLVDEKMRRQLGIYYTPRIITERIFRRLPVEDLRLEKRMVLDGTCGSGNLLLAAYDRLSSLLPARWTPEECHSYLLEHIWGVDRDPFACEIARLSLLLYNLPAGDDWQIEQGDVFEVNPQQMFGEMPRIIVGNPPFQEPRSTEGKRIQKAAQVLDRYLNWLVPEGLLGIIVPLTFLHTASAIEIRKRLLETCDILEVWHFPEGAIPGSSVAVAVILARKLPQARSKAFSVLTRVEEVDRVDQRRFGQYQEPTTSYFVAQERWFSDSQRWMVSSSFDHIWDRIEEQFSTVHPNFCRIYNGVQPGKQARSSHFSSQDGGKGWKRVLSKNVGGKTLEPFLIDWANQRDRYIRYPSDELQWPRKPEHFKQPTKLVMNATRNPENPWRFYAAIDRDRFVVTENFHYVLPAEGVTIEELAAVFNSMVANAWYSSHNYHRDITLKYLKLMPFPSFSEQQRKEIRNLVCQITEMKQSPRPSSEDIRRHIVRLDEVVFDAYGLNSEERTQVRNRMDRFPRPGQEWEGKPLVSDVSEELAPYQRRQWRLIGEIEAVNAERGTVSLWTQGRDGSKEIPIPSTMPGWALRPGAAFWGFIPWEQRHETDVSKIKWLGFRPLEFGYLSNGELTARFTEQESA
jgi:type I restriction-modification system DNA methylase subunit